MKVNELSIKKNFDKANENDIELENLFAGTKWKMLGVGQESVTAEHPEKKYVLKVFDSNSKYTEFVKFSEQNAGNPHVPVFNRYVKKIPGTPFSYVRMEKLTGIEQGPLLRNYFQDLVYLISYARSKNVTISYALESAVEHFLLIKYQVDKKMISNFENINEIFKRIRKTPSPAWKSISEKLIDFAISIRLLDLDLHHMNFMLRGTTLVFLDPFFEF